MTGPSCNGCLQGKVAYQSPHSGQMLPRLIRIVVQDGRDCDDCMSTYPSSKLQGEDAAGRVANDHDLTNTKCVQRHLDGRDMLIEVVQLALLSRTTESSEIGDDYRPARLSQRIKAAPKVPT